MIKERIDHWFNEAYINNKYLEGLDIHIDEIFPRVRKANWIKKSLSCINYLLTKKNRICPNFSIILSIRINSMYKDKLYNYNSLHDITEELLSYTPPSFYLCDNDSIQDIISKSLRINTFLELQNYFIYIHNDINMDKESETLLYLII